MSDDEQQQQQQEQLGLKRRRPTQHSLAGDDYECAVCLGLLLDPVVAPCGHDMCQHCYQRWASASACDTLCPLCRCALPSNLAVCLRLKKTIERLHPEASDKRRQEVALQLAEQPTSGSTAVAAQLPTYPLGPYSPQLFAQWAVAAAPPPPLFTMMYAAAQFMGGMQLAPEPALQQAASPATSCTAHASCTDVHHDGYAALEDPAAAAPWPSQQPQPRQRQVWQTAADSPMRLEVARAIIMTLQQRGWHSMLGPKLADAVRLLELVLYRTAATREAYLNRSDLAPRIVAAVQQRAAAASARRARLEQAAAIAPSTVLHARPVPQQLPQHSTPAAVPAQPV